MRKNRLGWVAIGLLFIGLFTVNTSSLAAEKVSLTLWNGYPETASFYQDMVAQYNKEHPNVEVTVLTYPLAEFYQKMAAAVPTGTGPDIIEASTVSMRKFVELGFAYPNQPEEDNWIREPGRFQPFMLQDLTYKEKTYGIPFTQGRQVLLYNIDMFREAGLSEPPKTAEQMVEYAQKLAKYDSSGNLIRSGISLRLSGAGTGIADKWWVWLHAYGGTLLKELPGGKYIADYNSSAGRKALELYIDLLYKYKVDSHSLKHDAEAFALGQTAMFTRESWVIDYVKDTNPDMNFGTALIPGLEGTNLTFDPFYILKSCKNPDIAIHFIMWLQQPENLQCYFKTTGWTPAREDVDYTEIYDKVPQYEIFMTSPPGYTFFGYYPIPCILEIINKLSERLGNAFLDKGLLGNPKGIAQVLDEAAKETNDILKANGLLGE